MSKNRNKSPPVVDIREETDDDTCIGSSATTTCSPVCADNERKTKNQNKVVNGNHQDETTKPLPIKTKEIVSGIPYCKDLNIPAVFSDTPSENQSKEPG